ncbi:hypothetical protein HN832_04050 [archaeon]|jgi:hypothetical protein|nr:hypothetical protein [archaeon]MBT4373433.1 hypothetical protein [archaeon]MBT4531881.1 hypothetical protein [archaeon]MBT7001548.1 hypothetical protein [archaeon]MBT7282560.1 hypothetical protein [archaeon]
MKKRKSPREIIEGSGYTKTEEALIKFPGEEPVDVSALPEEGGVEVHPLKALFLSERHGKKPYTLIHTHRFLPSKKSITVAPSPEDVDAFLRDSRVKTAVIAYKEKPSGQLAGYLVMKKSKETDRIDEDRKRNLIVRFKRKVKTSKCRIGKQSMLHSALDDLSRDAKFRFKIVPTEDYCFSQYRQEGEEYVSGGLIKQKSKDLSQKLCLSIGIALLSFSMFLINSSITGNIIKELGENSLNWVALILSFTGLLGILFYINKRLFYDYYFI